MKTNWMRLIGAPAAAALLALAVGCGGDSGAEEPKEAPAAEAEAAPAAEEKTPEPTPAPEAKADAGDNELGKTLFSTYCVSCHGESGKGDGIAGAALNPKPASFGDAAFWDGKSSAGDARTDDHLKKVIKEGGAAAGLSPLMAPWGAVLDTDEKLDAVVAYVKSFKPE